MLDLVKPSSSSGTLSIRLLDEVLVAAEPTSIVIPAGAASITYMIARKTMTPPSVVFCHTKFESVGIGYSRMNDLWETRSSRGFTSVNGFHSTNIQHPPDL